MKQHMTQRGRGSNLSHRARVRGGRRSARIQKRDEGRFAGRSAMRTAWDDTKRYLGEEE